MAITITVAGVAAAIRVGDTTEETALVTRLTEYATEAVTRHLGTDFVNTPDTVVNEAVIRVVGYLYDIPNAIGGTAAANNLRNSGAAAILLPYRTHRAGRVDPVGAPDAGTGGTGGTGGTTPSGPTVDAEARRLAGLAESTATDALNKANEAIGDIGDLVPLVTEAANHAAATEAEADAATETGLRSWSAALIRRVVNAVVPSWARAAGPPAGDVLHVSAANTFHGTANAIALNNVPDTTAGRRYGFFVEMANTAAVTVTVGTTSQPLVTNTGQALTGGELVPGEFIEIVDDGSSFHIIGGSATGHVGLADGSVTTAKLADEAVTGRKIAGDSVASGHLVDNAVTGSKIPSNTIATRHIAADTVTQGEIAGAAVGTPELAADAVTEAKLAAGVRSKLNARTTSTDATARAAISAEETARMNADVALGRRIDAAALGPMERLGLLKWSAAPNAIAYTGASDFKRTFEVLIDNAELLTDTLYYERDVSGSVTAAGRGRTAWTPRTHSINFEINNDAAAANLFRVAETNGYIVLQLEFWDAAREGAVVDIVRVLVATVPGGGATRTQIGGTTTLTASTSARLSNTDAAAFITAWNSGTYSRMVMEFARASDSYSQAEIWITGNVADNATRRIGFGVHFPIHSPDDPAEAGLTIDRRPATDRVDINAFDNAFASGTVLTIWGVP